VLRDGWHLVTKDLRLEGLEFRAWIQSELIVEHLPRALESCKRVSLAAAVVQREHQQAPQSLSIRVDGYRGLQLVDELRGPAQEQVRFDALFDRVQAQLLEAIRLHAERAVIRKIAERPATPQRKRLRKRVGGCSNVTANQPVVRRANQAIEDRGIYRFGRDVDRVSRRSSADGRRAGQD
jgi:hypothetical protein